MVVLFAPLVLQQFFFALGFLSISENLHNNERNHGDVGGPSLSLPRQYVGVCSKTTGHLASGSIWSCVLDLRHVQSTR